MLFVGSQASLAIICQALPECRRLICWPRHFWCRPQKTWNGGTTCQHARYDRKVELLLATCLACCGRSLVSIPRYWRLIWCHMSCVYLYSNCTCTHRGLKVRGIVPNHRKSPVCPNCFLFVSRDHQRSFLEDLAKCRADLRFSSHWWCSASNSVKRRQHAIIQNIDGKLNLRLTASLALGRGPLVSRQPQWASNSCHM